MINPGAGQAAARDRQWRKALIAFNAGRIQLVDVYAEQRRHMPHWNNLMPFIELHGLNVDNLAIVNVAWCASAGNKYPRHMLSSCWDRHTGPWLKALDPNVIVLSGTAVRAFSSLVAIAVPGCKIVQTFHYAHRPLDHDRARARAAELRQELAS